MRGPFPGAGKPFNPKSIAVMLAAQRHWHADKKRSEGQVFGPVADERGGVSCLLHPQKLERIKEERPDVGPGR
jgi:hypothetical protein